MVHIVNCVNQALCKQWIISENVRFVQFAPTIHEEEEEEEEEEKEEAQQ